MSPLCPSCASAAFGGVAGRCGCKGVAAGKTDMRLRLPPVITEEQPGVARSHGCRCRDMRGGAWEGRQGRRGGTAMACGHDDGASTPCARTGGARPIRVCGSVCVGDKVEREKRVFGMYQKLYLI